MSNEGGPYVLGSDADEARRLERQQEVWGAVTSRLLDRAGPRAGDRVLDLGCGPGLMLAELSRRCGRAGHVTALDESAAWEGSVRERSAREGCERVTFVRADVRSEDLGEGRFDFVFARWVLSFLPEVPRLLQGLARALRPGGVLAIQDYNHEGLSLFPQSAGFQAVVRATRQLVASRGGDLWIGARLPGLLRAAGLQVQETWCDVLCGGPDSEAFRWADSFFTRHCDGMVDVGVLTPDERARFLGDWSDRRRDSSTMFFSPIVVSLWARKPE